MRGHQIDRIACGPAVGAELIDGSQEIAKPGPRPRTLKAELGRARQQARELVAEPALRIDPAGLRLKRACLGKLAGEALERLALGVGPIDKRRDDSDGLRDGAGPSGRLIPAKAPLPCERLRDLGVADGKHFAQHAHPFEGVLGVAHHGQEAADPGI